MQRRDRHCTTEQGGVAPELAEARQVLSFPLIERELPSVYLGFVPNREFEVFEVLHAWHHYMKGAVKVVFVVNLGLEGGNSVKTQSGL